MAAEPMEEGGEGVRVEVEALRKSSGAGSSALDTRRDGS
jgi:hypothetical protein